ncbi:TRPM8 channel-associated factor homolog [Ambystoma mexicanum]|uniref:TRPM8 channel-associated factor homolog n=1 Tax=Ambystoma mexicanum TaxID=8296 RepID=UPI0037E75382
MSPAEAYKVLVAGIDTLDFNGDNSPCDLLLSGDKPFPLLVNSNGEVLVAASWYGKGKVLVLSHEEYLNSPKFSKLLLNAVRWLQPSPDAVVGVDSRLSFLLQSLSGAGIAAQSSEHFSQAFGVYCMNAYDDSQADDIVAFLKKGGGLLIGGQAWKWGTENGQQNAITNFPGNRIISVAGINFTPNHGLKGIFAVTKEIPAVKLVIPHGVDATPDLKHLLNGLTHMNIKGSAVPSELLVHGQLAFPVGLSNSHQCFVAAARYGRGRIVVTTHEGYMSHPPLKKFFQNVVSWLDNGRHGKIGVDKSVKGLHGLLKEDGFESEISGLVPTLSVYCCNAYNDGAAEKLHEFVAEGGGLLIGGHAWWWASQNKGKHAIAEHPGNKILNRFGISILPSSMTGDNFPALSPEDDAKHYHFRRALFQFQQHIRNKDEPKAPLTSWLPRLHQDCATVMKIPVQKCPMFAPFQRVFHRLVYKGGIPQACKEKPVKNKSKEAMLLSLVCAIDDASADGCCPSQLLVEPVHVPPTVPPISLEIDATNEGPAAWISTALYIPPAWVATITLPPSVVGKGLSVQIGCHSDSLHSADQFCRAPVVIRKRGVNEERARVSCLWGGLLYLLVPEKCKLGKIQVCVEGAVRAPFFRRGQTSKSDWLATIRHYPAPWAELATENLILTLPSDDVRSLEDPDVVLALWDRMMGAIAELAAIPPHFPRPERFVTDVQISAGWMHAGYPIMCHLPSAKELTNAERISSGGLWGAIHELGHNQQKRDWEFSPHTTEATCNLWSVYVHEKVLGIPRDKAHPALQPKAREDRIQQFLKNGRKLKDWSVWTALETYLQLQECFGWAPFIQLFSDYQKMSNIKNENNFKMNLWAEKFSQQVQKNLVPFFKSWDWPITDEVSAKLSSLPEWEANPMKRYNA